jgi:hypothetical protein
MVVGNLETFPGLCSKTSPLGDWIWFAGHMLLSRSPSPPQAKKMLVRSR